MNVPLWVWFLAGLVLLIVLLELTGHPVTIG